MVFLSILRNESLIIRSILVLLLLHVNFVVAGQTFAPKPSWSQEFHSWRNKPLNGWFVDVADYKSEAQQYTDSIGNLYCKNGFLHLRATADKRGNKVCSSARISTKGYKSFLYGKLEIRAKIQTGKGIFPAIWMLREDHGMVFPLGEIDIMEYIDCFESRQYHTTVHIVEKEFGKEEIRHKHYQSVEANMKKFHKYTLEWTANYLLFKLDGKEVNRVKKEDAEFWPFDVPYVLILNVAYGSWGAQCGTDESIFPKEMIIDWIRYYPLVNN